MTKAKVLVQPTGLLNARPWPEAGETVDLPDAVIEGMVASGHVEVAKPDPKPRVTKAAAAKVEKRPARTADVETRKA